MLYSSQLVGLLTGTLELNRIGPTPDDDGYLGTNKHGRTEVDYVFAVGDISGELMLAHAGLTEWEIAAAEIVGLDPSADRKVPTVAFTSPETRSSE